MRKMVYIAFMVLLVALASSCQRRGFSEHTTAINLKLEIKADVLHSGSISIPSMMRVDLFNPQTGQVEYTDYISAGGGYIYPRPGTYNMLIYNIGTESTIVRNENNLGTVEAYTNEVSAYLKSQMKSFLEKRYEMMTKSEDEPVTKDPVLSGTEHIVNEPDYLWVGRYDALEIPALELDEEREMTIQVEAASVVETWKIELAPVEGLEWISKVSALITGQTESTYIGKNEDSDGVVTIYFEMGKDTEKKSLVGTFNTFGKNPLYSSILSLDINIIDNLGNEHHYHFDITEDFFGNDEFFIPITEPIVIEEPKVEGGGFAPSVGDWEDVRTEIEL